jgi:DNA polymerase III epsilon subunit-like protein
MCEIGVMTPGDSILLESLVNLECSASVDARAKHGISDEELAAAPTLPHIWPTLQEALRDRANLVANNADFCHLSG